MQIGPSIPSTLKLLGSFAEEMYCFSFLSLQLVFVCVSTFNTPFNLQSACISLLLPLVIQLNPWMSYFPDSTVLFQFQNSAELPEELEILPHPLDTGETYTGSAFTAFIKNFNLVLKGSYEVKVYMSTKTSHKTTCEACQ